MSLRPNKRLRTEPPDDGQPASTKRPRRSVTQAVQDTPTPVLNLAVLRQRNKSSGAAKQTAPTSIANSRSKRSTVIAQEQASENNALRIANRAREKENRLLKRQLKKSQPQESYEPAQDLDEDYESEEGSDDNDVAFSSSITPMTGITVSSRNGNQMDPKLIRRVAGVSRKSTNPPRNAFMTPMTSRPATPTTTTASQGSPAPNSEQVQQETPSANDTMPQASSEALTAAEVNAGMRLPAYTGAFIKGGFHGRPAIANYAAPDCRIILAAAKAFEARIIAIKAFPSTTELFVWVDESWSEACRAAAVEIKLTDRVQYLIKSKPSHVRLEVLDIARAVVPPTYGFKADEKKASIKYNKRLYDSILTKFAFKDPKLSQGFMEHEVFVLLFRGWAFAKEHKPGALYEPLFNPVSIDTLAFLKLIVKYALDEWSTGRYVKGPAFRTKSYSSQYENHRKDVADWAGTVPTVTRKIRAKMFRNARQPFVTADLEPTGLDTTAVASITAELSRRTGDTDDEAGDDDDTDRDDDSTTDHGARSRFSARTDGVHRGKGVEGADNDFKGGRGIDGGGNGGGNGNGNGNGGVSGNGGDGGSGGDSGNGGDDGGNGGDDGGIVGEDGGIIGGDGAIIGEDNGNGGDDENGNGVEEDECEGNHECVIAQWLQFNDEQGVTRHWPQCVNKDGVPKRLPRVYDEAGEGYVLDGQFIFVAIDADGDEYYMNEDGTQVGN